jgi:gas vesicle protein
MILINNEWYNPKDLDDVSTIIREQFSYDLSDKIDDLVKEINYELEESIRDSYELEEKIEKLQKEIEALEMLERM